MRFAITASDSSLSVFNAFLKAGWEPVKLFVFSTQGSLDSNHKVIELAQSKNINVQLSRMTPQDLQQLGEMGCETLVVAGYKWRIGDWRPHLKHAVNFHPSPLPEGRGPYPIPRAILEKRKSWAVTCHQLDANFDTGDILANESFPLDECECHETLSLKVQMAAGRLAERVARNFPALWDRAQPQGAGSYWPKLTQEELTLNFSNPVETLMLQVRALGLLETLAYVNGVLICIRRAAGWAETHPHLPGTVVHINNKIIVVAAQNGFIGIIEWNIVGNDISRAFPQQH